MTTKELRKLPMGTQVLWDGKEHGTVYQRTSNTVGIAWADGQETIDLDEWALKHVTVERTDETAS